MDLFKDVIRTLNDKSENIMDTDINNEKYYSPYVVNSFFGKCQDSIFFADMLNRRPDMPNQWQYLFYYHGLPKARRFSGKFEKDSFDKKTIENICKYYKCSSRIAKQYYKLLQEDEIKEINNIYKET